MENKLNTDCKQKNSSSGFQKVLKIIGNIIFACIILLAVVVVFSLAQFRIMGGQPKILGNYMFIVLSGSMNPTFDARSMVFVKPIDSEQIKEGDIITFKGQGSSESLTTHRVVEIRETPTGEREFVTKGDANDVNDPYPISAEKVVGRVTIAIPYLGALLSYAQTKQGIMILLIIPGGLLILLQIHRIFSLLMQAKREKTEGKSEIIKS
ncbi:MAG: signal peptidase I [Peptococcaceae bacterium]|nr:signal peptidase I [Peptococcaceae bacterium]